MVACRGESVFYSAGEGRDFASGLERALSEEYRIEETADLIEFLRYGADVLDRCEIDQYFRVEFKDWR